MTLMSVADTGALDTRQAQRLEVGPIYLIMLIAVLAMSALNLVDPMLRHDDYPALFGDAPAFWNKTLHEGRWLNYLWHLRAIETPAWVNFAVYQALWALFAASLAVVACGPKGTKWFTVVLGLLVLVSPSEMLISLWFNTLIPGLAVVALFAFIACRVSSRALRLILPAFVIISFMAYTTYPMLLLAVCVAKTQERSLRDLGALVLLFCGSFVAAVLTVYLLNWQVHGVFGVPVADWREPTAAQGILGMVGNLPKLAETFTMLFDRNGVGYAPLIGLVPFVFIVAFGVLRKRAPLECLYLFTGLVIGIALTVVQSLKLGVIVPPRAFIFFWVFFALTVVRAVQLLSVDEGIYGRLGRNVVLLIIGVWFIQIFLFYGQSTMWRAETRALAQDIRSTEGPVYMYGDPSKITSGNAAGIQSYKALSFRMQQLTGRSVIACDPAPEACPARPDVNGIADADIRKLRTEQGLFLVFTPNEPSKPV